MSVAPPADGNGRGGTRITLSDDGRRELVWISRDSGTIEWRVDEVVSFRNSRWRVVERAEDDSGSVTLTLAHPH